MINRLFDIINQLFGIVKSEVFSVDLGDMEVDYPIHEVETAETNGENDAGIFVNG